MNPWDEPGFRFYTDDMRRWLNGYAPVLGADDSAPEKGKPRDAAAAQRLEDGRRRGAKARLEYGTDAV